MTKLSSKLWMFSLVALVAAVAMIAPDAAFAQTSGGSVGQGLFTDIQGLIQGNLGVLAGLLISLFGLWMWLVQQSSWGLIIVIAGAALTAFPGIYAGISQGIDNAFSDIQSDASSAKKNGSN
tara:strand:+ start:280484 stop:280849 length:366 start_codon:yes stop_codon:yes gene_type:complete